MPTRPCLPALRTLTGVAALFIAFAFVATEPARAASAADECDRLAAHPADGEKPIAVTGSIDIPQQDIVDAVRLCKEAAEAAGAPRRMWTQYGRALEFAGRDGEAAHAYRKSAELGSPLGMTSYAVMLLKGQGIAPNSDEARGLLEKAAGMGDTLAMTNLGSIYGAGIGVKTDFASARSWYEKAAAVGAPEAMYQLGLMQQDGDGVTKDDAAAKAWFEKAAKVEHAGAQFSLGAYAEEGRAGPKDVGAAIEFYKRAAAQGEEEAQAALERLRCPEDAGQAGAGPCYSGR